MHYTSVVSRFRNALLNPAWVCFLWAGITIGVSMIATPLRFTAQSISRPVALDVGRVVFAALNKAELAMLVALLVVVRVAGLTRQWWGICAFLTLIVLAQGVWLIPELSARTDIVIAGGQPPPSFAHAIYSSLELAKIAALLFAGFAALRPRS
ncbi:MAG: hypothetical protein KJO09_04020 [Gammaproteobacteria bacterium]|nr:hypothetical protein [Gammaproteobacteria bacterium]